MRQICTLPIPVIGAVNGVAAGAGANLALACDIVIAAESATFTLAFARIGQFPDAGGTYFLPAAPDRPRALRPGVAGRYDYGAKTAADWGLIWETVADAEFGRRQIACRAPGCLADPALALMKQAAMNASGHHSLEQQLALNRELQPQAAETEDFREGVQAFLEKMRGAFFGAEFMLPIADRWFEIRRIDDASPCSTSPHVVPLHALQHLARAGGGPRPDDRHRRGFAEPVDAARHLPDKPVAAVATFIPTRITSAAITNSRQTSCTELSRPTSCRRPGRHLLYARRGSRWE